MPPKRIALQHRAPPAREGGKQPLAAQFEMLEQNEQIARVPYRNDLQVRTGGERARKRVAKSLRIPQLLRGRRRDEKSVHEHAHGTAEVLALVVESFLPAERRRNADERTARTEMERVDEQIVRPDREQTPKGAKQGVIIGNMLCGTGASRGGLVATRSARRDHGTAFVALP